MPRASRPIRPATKMSIKEMLDKCPDFCEPTDSATISWGVKGIGWGQFTFYVGEDKKVHCLNEIMSKRFIKEQLCKMVDECILDEPPTVAYREDKKE